MGFDELRETLNNYRNFINNDSCNVEYDKKMIMDILKPAVIKHNNIILNELTTFQEKLNDDISHQEYDDMLDSLKKSFKIFEEETQILFRKMMNGKIYNGISGTYRCIPIFLVNLKSPMYPDVIPVESNPYYNQNKNNIICSLIEKYVGVIVLKIHS